jgi:hypothetical protein
MPRRLLILLTLPGCKGFLDVEPPGQLLELLTFEDVTVAAGITGSGPSFGAAWGDVDGDGDPDLWSGNHAEPPTLFINQGDGTFTEEREARVPLDETNYDAHGLNFVDLDADGDLDLVESVGGQRGQGFGRNNVHVFDGGRGTETRGELGLGHDLASGRCPIAYDWNLDKRIDLLFVAQPGDERANPSALFTQQADGTFALEHEVAASAVHPTALCGQLADVDGDLVPEVVRFGRPSHLTAHDSRSGTLADLNGVIGMPQAPTLPYDVVVADFDNDLDNDIFVTRWQEVSVFELDPDNGAMDLSLRLLADYQGVRFSTQTRTTLTLDPPGFWSPATVRLGSGCNPWVGAADDMRIRLDVDDITMHGRCEEPQPDTEALFIGYEDGVWEVTLSAPVFNRGNLTFRSDDPFRDVELIQLAERTETDRAEFDRDLLYLRENGEFVEDGAARGLGLTNCTSAAAGDFDNDMDLDLYLVCGTPLGNTPNLLYVNNGRGRFTLATDHGAEGPDAGRGDTVVVADYDGDGALDLFVNNGYAAEPYNNGPLTLLRNTGGALHWLEFDLTATRTHPDAHGATVRVHAGGVVQQREVTGGTHHMGQHHRRLHFGTGGFYDIDKVEIFWPSGQVQVLDDLTSSQLLTIVEPE